VLSCYDRIIVTGTLPGACYAKGMTGFLSARQIRIFDYARFAEPLRDRVRDRATIGFAQASPTSQILASAVIVAWRPCGARSSSAANTPSSAARCKHLVTVCGLIITPIARATA
jgi:hypothetical protein